MASAATAPMPHPAATTPLSLMSCVRESSPPLQDHDSSTDQELDKNEPSKKRRFHPFRGLRKMFRRRVRHSGGDETVPEIPTPKSETTPNKDTQRSRSTSELLAGDEIIRRKSGSGLYGGHAGLSVSHDSVFTGDPHSGSDMELDTAQSSSSLSIKQLVPGVSRTELLDAVRRRRGPEDTSEDDEDLGLPRSPCNSPSTGDNLMEKSAKEHATKSHSTCSDGSLLSMGSSEMDEDSFGLQSQHSSKVSLHDKRLTTSIGQEIESELDLGDSGPPSAPLSHSAARHKMSVRPKRTHGVPRRRRVQQLTSVTALPTTPEVNEDTLRSGTPETSKQDLQTLKLSTTGMQKSESMIPTETRLKSSSLPPGLALSSAIGFAHLPRSRSNAAASQESAPFPRSSSHEKELESGKREVFSAVGEEDETEKIVVEKKKEESFFGRLLSRRSGKKKKEKIDEHEIITTTTTQKQKESIFNAMNIKKRIDEKGRYTGESISETTTITHYTKARTGPASRQRVEPIDIPASPELVHRKVSPPDMPKPLDSPINKFEAIYKLPPTGLPRNSPEVELNFPQPEPKSSRITEHDGTKYQQPAQTRNMKIITCGTPKAPSQKDQTLMSPTKPDQTITFGVPKTEGVQFRIGQMKSSPDRTSFLTQSPHLIEQIQSRQKRMDAYAAVVDTSTKIVNEEIEKIKEDPPLHSRQRRGENISIDLPVTTSVVDESNKTTSTFITEQVVSSTQDFSGVNRMQVSYSVSPPHKPVNTDTSTAPIKPFENFAKMQQQSNSRITITSYQQKSSKYSTESAINVKTDYGFASLNHVYDANTPAINSHAVAKSQSFKHKMLPAHYANDLPSLPFNINTDVFDGEYKLPDLVDSTKEFLNAERQLIFSKPINIPSSKSQQTFKQKQIKKSASMDSIQNEIIKTSEPAKSVSIESVTRSVPNSNEFEGNPSVQRLSPQESARNIVTVSCTPIVTMTDNLVTVSVATPESPIVRKTSTESSGNESQTSVTKVQLKRCGSQVEKSEPSTVPEFLKIQLNKVDAKPATNVVLSTSITMLEEKPVETDPVTITENINLDTKVKRRFSKDHLDTSDTASSGEETGEIKNVVENGTKPMKVVEIGKPKSRESSPNSIPRELNLPPTDVVIETTWKALNGSVNRRQTVPPNVAKTTPSSPVITKPFLAKKSNSLELIEMKRDKRQALDESNVEKVTELDAKEDADRKLITEGIPDTVVLRKKSVPVLKKDDEPELLKVFARRSLKLNSDSDIGQVIVMLDNIEKSDGTVTNGNGNSRDSDKENEADSPRDERKKSLTAPSANIKDVPKSKEILSESKMLVEKSEVIYKTSAVTNVRLSFGGVKYPRTVSVGSMPGEVIDTKEMEKPRCKTVIETKGDKFSHGPWPMKKDRDVDNNTDNKTAEEKSNATNEDFIPRFKRIQQRKEEWEQRAQQAMKKTVP